MKKQTVLLGLVILLATIIVVPMATADSPIEGRDGRAEVRFLEGMIDHHQMALDMAQDCLSKAQSEVVLTLCQNIIDTQSAEIETMRGWLLTWYNIEYSPMAMSNHMSMMGMMTMMDSMTMGEMMDMMESMSMNEDATVSQMMEHMGSMGTMEMDMPMGDEGPYTDMAMMMGMMAGFNRLEGAEYESAWLESMIDHHDDALHMSERILEHTVHPETADLAQQIIAAQTTEITEMEALLSEFNAAQ